MWAGLTAGPVATGQVAPGRASTGPEPSALFSSVYQDYLHGNLRLARTRAAMAERQLVDQPFWAFKLKLLEAEILLRQNRPREAAAVLPATADRLPNAPELAVQRTAIAGLAHYRLGQPRRSAHELRLAHQLAEATHSVFLAEVLRAQALVLREAGQQGPAIQKFKASLAAARAAHDPLVQAADLVDLGVGYQNGRHFDEALFWLQQAVDFARSVGARRQLELALGNRGWLYTNLGDFQRSLADFGEAVRTARQLGMVVNEVLWLQDAGVTEYQLGHLAAARRYDEEALQTALCLPPASETDEIVNIETNLAFLAEEEGEHQRAQSYSDAAILAARGSRDENVVAYATFLGGLLAARHAGDHDAQHTLLTALRQTTDPDVRANIQIELARWHAGQQHTPAARRWYRRALRTFETNRSSRKTLETRLTAFGLGASIYQDYARFLIRSKRTTDALEILDRSRGRTLDEALGVRGQLPPVPQRLDPRAVARKLGAPILFYSLGSTESYLWAITADDIRLFTLPPAGQIQDWVEQYQRLIQRSSDPLRTGAPAAVSLYNTLIAPAAPLIASSSRLFVVPDGALHALNFETLLKPGPGGPHYFIEEVTLSTASSIRMLANLRAPRGMTSARELLLIGDPLPARGDLDALQHAGDEVRGIQQYFAPERQLVLTQAKAVPAAYTRSAPGRFRYIHFLAHGMANRLSPLDSAVVLSPPPRHPDDFKLYARDILRHPLRADLVTISSCYSSGVRAYPGEGLVGLAWVFLRAGSHNVIGALWEADDAATPQLMQRLYGELHAGKSPDQALRDAKLALLRSAGVFRKPFYWGAFQLYAGS